MKIKAVVVLLIVGIVVLAKVSRQESFSQARDFPSGALVYLQVADLPEFITLINDSKAKEKYLKSQNLADFQTSHLGLKLAERWNDFNNAVGFPIDLQTLSGLTEKQAAVALYDIGKLEFVLVTPLNEEIFAATMFAQNSNKFEQNTLEDGTSFYKIEFKVDRERQNQKLIFANIKGRFVLAASEKLFFRTIAAINGKQRLYDDANFKKLSGRITPNLATIWVDQDKLNADYYFKRYWLMSKVEDLKNIRAGIFDIDFSEEGLIERREFLLRESLPEGRISMAEAGNLLAKVPADVPFYRLERADEGNLGEAIYTTIFDKQNVAAKPRKYSNSWSYSAYDDYGEDYRNDFESLDSNFDEAINEPDDEEIIEEKPFRVGEISDSLKSARPSLILTAKAPKILESPLFVEFRNVAIVSLQNPNAFRADLFEATIIEGLKNRITVARAGFEWVSENGMRRLRIPMLGWEIAYHLTNDKLIISNSLEFLQSMAVTHNTNERIAYDFDNLTVIRLQNHEQNFETIMAKLPNDDGGFFTLNIGGLLGMMNEIEQIEVKKNAKYGFLSEEIFFKFLPAG